ncbi:transcription initiation factor TFIID subunit 4-like [Equus asinus]|uniref:transcription initiation factor TFIID subunit 4-like n=1 Tax=Equus asinus TaxID=9793 RepID=UPI0038F80202
MSQGPICREEPSSPGCHPPRRPPSAASAEGRRGPEALRGQTSPAPGGSNGRLRQLSSTPAEAAAASHGAAEGRAGRWRCRRAPAARAPIMAARAMAAVGSEHAPPRAHAAAPGLRGPSPEPPPPPPALRPPLTGCSGIFSSDAAFKMAAPPPGNPSVVPCSRRRAAAILSPVPPPLADIYIAKIGPAGLRPSPHACSLRLPARPRPRAVPRAGHGADLGPLSRLPGHRATLPQPPPVYGARLRRRSGQPGSSPGLTAASSGPARRRAPHRPA